jgi:hypothetical protein
VCAPQPRIPEFGIDRALEGEALPSRRRRATALFSMIGGALQGFNVINLIVPLDTMPPDSPYHEQFAIVEMADIGFLRNRLRLRLKSYWKTKASRPSYWPARQEMARDARIQRGGARRHHAAADAYHEQFSIFDIADVNFLRAHSTLTRSDIIRF